MYGIILVLNILLSLDGHMAGLKTIVLLINKMHSKKMKWKRNSILVLHRAHLNLHKSKFLFQWLDGEINSTGDGGDWTAVGEGPHRAPPP